MCRVNESIHRELATAPGDLVLFNGDKLWHAVTPLGDQEERIVLTMEYVTNPEHGPIQAAVFQSQRFIRLFWIALGLQAVPFTSRVVKILTLPARQN